MAGKSPIILILGAGANVGHSVARDFAAKGYRVALASRKAEEANNTAEQMHVASDFSDPGSVVNAFSKVKEVMGIPSVVVYNAGAVAFNPKNDPFSTPLAAFEKNLNINTTSPFVAAQQAVAGFAELPEKASKTFIYTGNILNVSGLAHMVDMGAGKSAMAHIIQAAAAAYEDRGFKFYYADERKADGAPAYSDIDGDAHGEHYLKLSEQKTQGPWQQTFVKGTGYKSFL